MSERTDEFVNRCRAAIVEITDPAELQRQLREMVEQEFPVAKPAFEPGERMPLHEFIARFQKNYCQNLPAFYRWPVIAGVDAYGDLCMIFAGTRAARPTKGSGGGRESLNSGLPTPSKTPDPFPEAVRG